MCVGILVPYPNTEKGEVYKPVPLETLQACEKANPAGGGIAWVAKNGVYFRKGLTAEEIFELQKPLVPPYQIHFRIPTTGGSDKRLCHPFPVNKTASLELDGYAKATLMHNGHWGSWKDALLCNLVGKFPAAPWSDTRAMAYLAHHYDPEILDLIDEKVCMLFADGSYRFFGKNWHEHEGAIYTNLGWKNRIEPRATHQGAVPFQKAGTGLQKNREGYKSTVDGAEITVWPSDDDELAVIKEWAKWIGIKSESVDIALAEAKAAKAKALAPTAEMPKLLADRSGNVKLL